MRSNGPESGMGLIGMMISISISGIIVLSILSATVYSHRAQRGVRLAEDFVDLVSEIKIAMETGTSSTCTRNLNRAITQYETKHGTINFNNPASAPAVPLPLSYFKADGTVDRDIAAPGATTIGGIKIRALNLVTKANIATDKVMFEIQVEGEKTGEVQGSKISVHRIPLFGKTEAATGKFISCTSTGMSLEDTVCDLMAEGNYIYNTETGKCEPLYEEQCFDGTGTDPNYATCPAGTLATDCRSNVIDPLWKKEGTPEREYANGESKKFMPRPYLCEVTGPTTVRCHYAADLTAADLAGVKCSPCCNVKADPVSSGGATE